MEVLAFRVGHFAYVTDCSKLPERTIELLQGLDVLILDGLRERPHKTHFNLEGAVAAVEVLRPKKTYLTHISHELDHEIGNARLRSLTDCAVELGYDGLEISL
jgi:phosphoribosyl 1,2-cyclic phosphate phosphodiesterase